MSRALTIAHVLGSFGMGGAERVALDLAVAQQRAGHRVLAISLSPEANEPLDAEFRAAGLTVLHIPKRPGLDYTLPMRVFGALRSQRINVLHTHNPRPLVYAAPAGRALRVAVIHTKHGEGHQGSQTEKLLRKLASPLARSFVAVSQKTADQILQQRDTLLPGRITVIRNGINLDRFRPDAAARRDVRSELGIPDDAWVMGTVGRVDRNKNQLAFVRAATPRLGESFQLILVGDGPEIANVRAAVADLPRPEFVHVLGRRNDAGQVMAALDVFVLPSLSEGLPLVIPEAMTCALPVISTAVGGIPAVVIEGQTGYLVPPDDDDALRDSLARLADDRDHARALGQAGRERALTEYSAARMSREYLDLYHRAL